MDASTDTAVDAPATVRLPSSVGVRECPALKQQLLELLDFVDAVLVDATDVELIDTAALQLLFAFGRERNANGLSTIWRGDSPAFRNAATAMGLRVDQHVA